MAYRPEVVAGVSDVDLSGSTVLVTGSTDGLGREAALALGRLGADVLVHGRDPDKGAAVVGTLRAIGSDVAFHAADFTSLDAVRGLAAFVEGRVDRLDVLVNNAGAYFRVGRLADVGVERTFVANHLAPFLLTNRLRPLLPASGRVVTVSSAAHRRGTLDLDAIRTVEGYDGFAAYARSKLANILFTRELAGRLDGPTANSLHPGLVPGTGLWREARLPVRLGARALGALPGPIVRRVVDTPASAAVTPVYLAASPAVADATGRYFVDRAPATPSAAARDDGLARRLWDASADVVGLGGDGDGG